MRVMIVGRGGWLPRRPRRVAGARPSGWRWRTDPTSSSETVAAVRTARAGQAPLPDTGSPIPNRVEPQRPAATRATPSRDRDGLER